MTIDVDIFGACTIRDAFEFSPILKSKFKVNKFIQNNSILTLSGDSLESIGVSIGKDNFKLSPPCWFKWFDLNANKKVFSYLTDNNADFLIINLTETYYTFYEILNPQHKVRICNQYGISVNKIFNLLPEYKTINPLDLSFDEIKLLIQSFAKKLLSIYNEERIIFVINYPAKYYITDNDSYFYEYDVVSYDKIIAFLSKVYKVFIDCFKHIKLIDLPLNSKGYDKHKWGLNNQHYILDVYEYLGRSIDYAIKTTINGENKFVVNHDLYLKSLDFQNYIYDKFANYKIYSSPYIDFCIRYASIRVLIISTGCYGDSFEIKNITPKSVNYRPKWVKSGNSMMILSDSGDLKFDISSNEELTLKIYLQSIDSHSVVTKSKYKINIILTSLNINNDFFILPDNRIIISHDKPYVFDYVIKPSINYTLNVQYIPDNYF